MNPALLLGAVAIPERHTRNGDEHLRLIAKQEAGCSYFVSQVVYDGNAAKNLVSDYAYECRERGLDPVPIVFTLVGVRLDEDAGVPPVARRRRAALDRKRPAPRRRHPRRILAQAEATAPELISFADAWASRSASTSSPSRSASAEIEASVRLAGRILGTLAR